MFPQNTDVEAEADAIGNAANATWWMYDVGSHCFYWRWPQFYLTTIRDGMDVFFRFAPLPYLKPQRGEGFPSV